MKCNEIEWQKSILSIGKNGRWIGTEKKNQNKKIGKKRE